MAHASRLASFLLLATAAGARSSAAAPAGLPPALLDVSVTPADTPGAVVAHALVRLGGDPAARTRVVFALGAREFPASLPAGAAAGSTVTADSVIPVPDAKRWTPEAPHLYQLKVRLSARDRIAGRARLRFPVRDLRWQDGAVRLNGAPFQLRAARLDPGPTDGSATGEIEAALARIKALGFNAVLFRNREPGQEVLAWCDAHGLLAPVPPALAAALVPVGGVAVPETLGAEALARGLDAEFGSASAFVAGCRERLAWSARRAVEAVRLSASAAGYAADDPEALAASWPRLNAPRLLVARTDPELPDTGTTPRAAYAIAGPPPPAGARLEWQFVAPGEERKYATFWNRVAERPGPAGAFPLAAVVLRGNWLFLTRLVAGRRVLAEDETPFTVGLAAAPSQISYGVLGDPAAAPVLYPSWIIPVEYAPIIVVPHPASVAPVALARLLRDVREGRRALFLDVDEAGAAALNATPGFPFTVSVCGAARGAERVGYVRAAEFGHRLPAVGPRARFGWFTGEAYEPSAAPHGLVPPLGASVLAGAVVLAAGAAPVWRADVMSVAWGRGHLDFCEWRLGGRVPTDPVATAAFLALLAR